MCGRGIGNLLLPLVAASVLATNGAVQIAPAVTAQTACPNCKTAISPMFEWCPNCGTGLKSHACAYCSNQMKSDARFCLSCGAPASNKGSRA